MSRFIDRVMNTLRGGGAEHRHDHAAQSEQGGAPEHGGEAESPGDDKHAGGHEHDAHEGHKHC